MVVLADQDDVRSTDKLRYIDDWLGGGKAGGWFSDAHIVDGCGRSTGRLWQREGFTPRLQRLWKDYLPAVMADDGVDPTAPAFGSPEPVRPPVLEGVGRDIGWTYISVIATGVTALLLPMYAIRRTSAADYGTFALLVAATSVVAPVEAGLGLVGRRSAAIHASLKDSSSAEADQPDLIALKRLFVLLGWVAVGATLVAATFLSLAALVDGPVVSLTCLLGASVALNAWTGAEQAVLIGRREFRTTATAAAAGAALTIVLLPVGVASLGIVGLAVAALAGTALHRGLLFLGAHRSCSWLPQTLDPRGDRTPMSALARSALPLVLIGVGGYVVATTDVFVIGATASAAAVGLYRVASLLPTQVASVIFRGYDAVFPSLAANLPYQQEEASRFLTKGFSYLSGVVFGVVILHRGALVRLLTGDQSVFASEILVLFCLIWIVNLAAHGLALLLIARGEQKSFLPLVLTEAAANLILSVILARRFGPVGAAWATLVTLFISNALLLPRITRKRLDFSAMAMVLRVGLGSAVAGMLIAAAVSVGVRNAVSSTTMSLVISAFLATVLSVLVGWVVASTQDRCAAAALFRRRPSVP